jgi:hypothetical protein
MGMLILLIILFATLAGGMIFFAAISVLIALIVGALEFRLRWYVPAVCVVFIGIWALR